MTHDPETVERLTALLRRTADLSGKERATALLDLFPQAGLLVPAAGDVRALQAAAWNEGYGAACVDTPTNPYDPEQSILTLLDQPAAAPAPVDGVGGWQPIETAPKDGSVILLAASFGQVVAGWWSNAPESRLISGVAYPWVFIDDDPTFDGDASQDAGKPLVAPNGMQEGKNGPTHWRPLPAAPTPPRAGRTEGEVGE